VPQDIILDSATKSTMAVGESQKVDKAPSPQAEKSTSEPLKPPSPKGVPNPDSAEFPEAPPPSTQLYGLEATGGL
jgi:hypothetical protein